jgi:transglutaminase-like putative cysteine protease
MPVSSPRLSAAQPRAYIDPSRWIVAGGALVLLLSVGCNSSPVPAGRAAATDQPPAATGAEETWDAVFMKGAHLGSVHTTTTRQDGLVTIVSDTQLSIPRSANVARMRVVAESVETQEGALRSFTHQTESGASPIVLAGHVRADQLVVTQRTMGKQTTTELPWTEGQGGFFAVENSLSHQPMQPGEHRTVQMLWPGLTGVQVATATLAAQDLEQTPLLDESPRLLRIRQTVQMQGFSLDGLCWTDARGEILKSTLLDPPQEIYRTTRQRALATPDRTTFNLLSDTLVPVATPLLEPHATSQVVYEATLERGNPAEIFASGATQQVKKIDDHRALITVHALRPGQPPAVPAETPPTDADRSANSFIQSDDQHIRELASTIAPEVTDPWQLCVALEQWVCRGIRTKNFNQGFSTAADVAQSLEGDCTEHAVLLAALCRARGVPARVCLGLVYSARDQGFAFHMWNEAWIADRWIPIDATLGLGGIGAAHLKLRDSNLATEQAEAAVMSVMQVMNQLHLQIVEQQATK